MSKSLVAVILVVLISCFFGVACSQQSNLVTDAPRVVADNASGIPIDNVTENGTSLNSPFKPFRIELSLPYAPLLNQEVALNCTLYSLYDCPEVRAWLYLPDGSVALDGSNIYTGKMSAGQELSIIKPIIFQKSRFYPIEGHADFIYSENFTGKAVGFAVLTVGVDKSTLGVPTSNNNIITLPKVDNPPISYPDGHWEYQK